MWNKLWKAIEHNRHFYIALAICAAYLAFLLSCQSRTASPFDGTPVTRGQLNAQITAWNAEHVAEQQAVEASVEAAVADLDYQDSLKTAGFAAVEQVASTSLGAWAAPILGILSIGLGLDNRRKDGLIAANK